MCCDTFCLPQALQDESFIVLLNPQLLQIRWYGFESEAVGLDKLLELIKEVA